MSSRQVQHSEINNLINSNKIILDSARIGCCVRYYLTFPNDEHKYYYKANKPISIVLQNKISKYIYTMSKQPFKTKQIKENIVRQTQSTSSSSNIVNNPAQSSSSSSAIVNQNEIIFNYNDSFQDNQTQFALSSNDVDNLDYKTKIHVSNLGKFASVNVIRKFSNIYEEIPELAIKIKAYDKRFAGRGLKGVRVHLINDEGKPRVITIPPELIDNKDKLTNYFANIENIKNGSDRVESGSLTLVNNISFFYIEKPEGRGVLKKQLLLPIIDENDSPNDDCIKKMMNSLGHDYENNESIDDLISYLRGIYCEDICIVMNTLDLNEEDEPEEYETNENYKMVRLKWKKRDSAVYHITKHGFKIKYLYKPVGGGCELNTHHLMWCGDHICLTQGFNEIKDDFYYCDGDILLQLKDESYINLTNKSGVCDKLSTPLGKANMCVYFDYETVISLLEPNQPFKAYSLSYYLCSEKEASFLDAMDTTNKNKTIAEQEEYVNGLGVVHLFGFDCSKIFVEDLIKLTRTYTLTLIGFNNSNFDNFFLTNEFLLNSLNDVQIFYANNSILDFNINACISSFDLARHLIGTLDYNCSSFKINCFKKQQFDHNYAQNLYDKNVLLTDKDFQKRLKKYNNHDVLCLPILHVRYENALNKITRDPKHAENDALCDKAGTPHLKEKCDNRINLIGHVSGVKKLMTIGSVIYKLFTANIKKMGIDVPIFVKSQIHHYDNILKYSSAGRCDLRNNEKIIVNEKIASPDVCSLYPYVMAVGQYWYPCGNKIIDTKSYKKDKMGYYWVSIDQTNLKQPIQCNKNFDKNDNTLSNDWNCFKINNVFICTERIKYLIDNGCVVTTPSGGDIFNDECEGIYFTDRVKGCVLFEPILKIMGLKMQQDRYKADGNELYNPALRETTKLLSNSLSGKVIEKLHLNKYELVDNDDLRVYLDDVSICQIYEKKVMISYTAKKEKEFSKHRPVFWGNHIYTYAQQYLYDHVIKNAESFYYDTDSAKMTHINYESWDKNYASNRKIDHWPEVLEYEPLYKTHLLHQKNSKLYGSFEDELSGMDQKISYFDGKKQYAIISNKLEESKIVFKGIKVKYDDKHEKIISNDPLINTDNKIDNMFKYYNDNKNIINDWEDIFNKLHHNEPVSFLTGTFSRVIKTDMKNQIYYNNRVKTIGGSDIQRKDIKSRTCLYE